MTDRVPAWFVTAAVLALGVVGAVGFATWTSLGADDVANPAAAAMLTRGAAVASVGCAVLALPFALRLGRFPWVLPSLLSVGCVALVVGWRSAGTGSAWGAAGLAVAVLCGIAAVVSVLFVLAPR